MFTIDDLPDDLFTRLTLDDTASFFIKDQQIPGSYVVVEKTAQKKNSYIPLEIGTAHPYRNDFFLYEESISDIGGGIFEIQSKYAKVPPTWYSFESQSIPFTKFSGVTVVGSGGIVISQSYKFSWLNLQGIDDVRNFNQKNYVDSTSKQGSINCVVRVKHEYKSSNIEEIQNGTLKPFEIKTADYEPNLENG